MEDAAAATPKRSVEQFRVHLLERISDAARAKLRIRSKRPLENGHRELWGLVGAEADASLIDGAAIRAGMTTMLDDAVEKCRAGMTAAPEVLRVTSVR
jgi:hypothetical protein